MMMQSGTHTIPAANSFGDENFAHQLSNGSPMNSNHMHRQSPLPSPPETKSKLSNGTKRDGRASKQKMMPQSSKSKLNIVSNMMVRDASY